MARVRLRRWGAVYLMVLLFLASWIGQFFAMLIDAGNESNSWSAVHHGGVLAALLQRHAGELAE